MPDKITITGTLGPDIDVTSLIFNNVTELNFLIDRQVLEIKYNVQNTIKTVHFDLYTIATVTYTISSHVATVVASV